VREDIAIPLERPRALKLKRDPRFHALEDRIWALIQEDSIRALHRDAMS
jgi:hypothetical protein